MRKTKKNMKFGNKNKNYYKHYSNNRAYINRRLPLFAKAGMIENRSSPTRVPEGLPVGTLSSLMGLSSVPEGTLLTTSDYSEHEPMTNEARQQAFREYSRNPLYTLIDDAFNAGVESTMYEVTHPWERYSWMGRNPTPIQKKNIEQIRKGFDDFINFRNKEEAIRKQVRAAATMTAYKNARDKTRKSNIKTALLSGLLGAAAAHGAHLYMGTNQPQPPQPTQSYMSLPSGMQQSLADLTRRARGKKRTRRRHKNRK